MTRTPHGLGRGGRALWRSIAARHELDAIQRVTLLEACRVKDRLDRLDAMIRDGEPWASLPNVVMRLDAERQVNQTADLLKRLLASLRLPDRFGRRPQRRGTPRGAYPASAVRTRQRSQT